MTVPPSVCVESINRKWIGWCCGSEPHQDKCVSTEIFAARRTFNRLSCASVLCALSGSRVAASRSCDRLAVFPQTTHSKHANAAAAD